MSSNIKSIVNVDVNNKVVILRADLNIPIVNGVVQDHTRLNRLIPTINYLLDIEKIPSIIDLRNKDGVALNYGSK